MEGLWARFWVLRAPFWSDSGTIVGSILKRVEVDFQTCWGQSSLLSLLVKFDMFVLFLALQLACFLSLPRDRARKLRKTVRETHETFQLQTPGERAQRASKGCTRPTTLAILMLAMLSPRWLRCASWCFALVLLAIVCASLLVFSVACDACGSRFSRASRSSLVRFPFWGCSSNPWIFQKNATHSTRKPCFLRPGGSQMEPT